MHATECATQPCITLAMVDALYDKEGTIQTLAMVDALYDKEGTIQRIVRGMFTGMYSLTTSREPLNQQASDMAADLFIAKYGHECTLYAMMHYFGNYLTEYKASYC